jgi:hypothetical protein
MRLPFIHGEHEGKHEGRDDEDKQQAFVKTVKDQGKCKGGYGDRQEDIDGKVPGIGNVNRPKVKEQDGEEGDVREIPPVNGHVKGKEIVGRKNHGTN